MWLHSLQFIHECQINRLLFKQVKNKSSAVLLDEIEKFVLPGTTIVSDALASYNRLQERGFEHKYVIHKKEFVNSEDRSIHTQNIEIRNRWTKGTIKSYEQIDVSTHTAQSILTGSNYSKLRVSCFFTADLLPTM